MNDFAREREGYLLGSRMNRFHPSWLFECAIEEKGFFLFLGFVKQQW
jgi:hypothetical protein